MRRISILFFLLMIMSCKIVNEETYFIDKLDGIDSKFKVSINVSSGIVSDSKYYEKMGSPYGLHIYINSNERFDGKIESIELYNRDREIINQSISFTVYSSLKKDYINSNISEFEISEKHYLVINLDNLCLETDGYYVIIKFSDIQNKKKYELETFIKKKRKLFFIPFMTV
ncbi:MAG: hypothetical protein HUJ68_05950 [Clostridia bacterium]|nr:hypothetical protein [Clostridia bacterium]